MASLLGPAPPTTPRGKTSISSDHARISSIRVLAYVREHSRERLTTHTRTCTHNHMRRQVHGDPALRSRMKERTTNSHHRERGVVTEEVVG